MLFTTVNFLFFLIIVFFLYWSLGAKYQKGLLLVSSNIFYAFWDYRFLLLLNLTIFIDFFCGNKIFLSKSDYNRRLWLLLSITSCLSILFFFKYLNFFVKTISELTGNSIQSFDILSTVILPVGISFYTFHGISYVVDIYRGKVSAEKQIVNYGLFVSYFPLLVAGPIERATNLLAQISNKVIKFDYSYAIVGLRLILVGIFKKIVLADNLGGFVDEAYNYYYLYNGTTLFVATFLFGLQIYFDFSAYTNIASGVSKLFGYDLVLNFNYPYFAKSPQNFWNRWHISLSSFFRDYVYFPLGGSRKSFYFFARNILIVFIISGLWHGANVTFILWGLYHGLLVILNKPIDRIFSKAKFYKLNFFSVFVTYILINVGWVFFRSPDISTLVEILEKYKNPFELGSPYIRNGSTYFLPIIITFVSLLIEFYASNKRLADVSYLFEHIRNRRIRWSIYYIILFTIVTVGSYAEKNFIYFQF